MLAERSDHYEAVQDLGINTDKLTLDEILFGIVESARVALQLG